MQWVAPKHKYQGRSIATYSSPAALRSGGSNLQTLEETTFSGREGEIRQSRQVNGEQQSS